MWKQGHFTTRQIIYAIAFVPLAVALSIALIQYFRLVAAAVPFPYPLDYGEGPILDQTLRLSRFENIYRNSFASPPYTVSNYPPLFHLLQAPFTLLFGPAFWYGRLISVLSTLASAILTGLILHTLTNDRLASAISGLVLLSFPYLAQWSLFDRVDSLALALSLGGLFAAIRFSAARSGIWIAGLLFTAAIFTRQSYALTAPLTALAWLLVNRQRRRAGLLFAILAFTSLGLFLLLNFVTRGGFYLNLVTANLNPFSWFNVTRYMVEIYLNAGFLLVGCVFFVVVDRLGEWSPSWPVVTVYLFAAALIAITVGKAGSSVNYLFEFCTALSLGFGALIAWAKDHVWLKIAFVLVLAYQVNGLTAWLRQEYAPQVMEKVGRSSEVSQIAKLVSSSPQPILADEYMGLLPLSGRAIYFQPFEFTQLVQTGAWDESALLDSIRRREFSAILLYEPRTWNAISTRWTPEMRQQIYAHYQNSGRMAETFIYLPKDEP